MITILTSFETLISEIRKEKTKAVKSTNYEAVSTYRALELDAQKLGEKLLTLAESSFINKEADQRTDNEFPAFVQDMYSKRFNFPPNPPTK